MKQPTFLYLSTAGNFFFNPVDACPNDCQKVKVLWERAFPNRFDWQCSTCGNWNRYFESVCPVCDKEN